MGTVANYFKQPGRHNFVNQRTRLKPIAGSIQRMFARGLPPGWGK